MSKIVLATLFAGLAVASIVAVRYRPAAPAPAVGLPAISYTERIEFPECEIGEIAVGRVTIANRGGSELVIDDVSTSCSCTGLEREESGEYVKIVRLVVRPGEEVPLVVRVAVRGVPIGASTATSVYFRTNDPNYPNGTITTAVGYVKGGVHAVPGSMMVGSVPIGASVVRTIDVRDDALRPRRVESAVSSHPERVSAILLPVEAHEREKPHPEGRLVARVEVTVHTATPGDIDAAVSLSLEGADRQPDRVRVVGKVVAAAEVSPARVSLPRRSSSGPVYFAQCLVHSSEGQEFALSLSQPPRGVTATVSSPGETLPVHTVEIAVARGLKAEPIALELAARFPDGRVIPLALTVDVQSEAEGR